MANQHFPSLGASSSPPEPERRRLSSLWWLLRLCALGLAVELVYAVLSSPRLALRTIEVRGDREVCAQVAGRLQLPRNTNFFLAPTEQLARQVASVPAVRMARVARDFPGRLVVTVERREPVAVIRSAEQALLVDAQGVVYSIRNEWGWGQPELVAPHVTPETMGEGEAKVELARLLAVLRAFGPSPRLGLARLELDRGDEITAVLESGAQVRLGTEEQLPAKIRLLAAVLRKLGPEHIASLDLSDPNGAYWHPRDAQAAHAGEGR